MVEGEPKKEAGSDTSRNNADPLKTWIWAKRRPSQYFEQDSQARDVFDHNRCLEEPMEESNLVVQYVEINGWKYPRPMREVPTSLRRRQSD